MDVKTISRLAEVKTQHQLSELEVDDGQVKLRLARQCASAMAVTAEAAAAHASKESAAAKASAAAAETAAADAAAAKPVVISSPLVGTFYAAPTPEAAHFVSVGSVVGPDSVVCIVEAMKVMNEIKAEKSGTITKVLVSNGAAVEYGQPLFEINVG